MSSLANRLKALESILSGWPSALVAYSGGVDSAFLLHTAHRLLGSRVTGILGDSASLPRSEHSAALAFALSHSLPLEVITTKEMENPAYTDNPPDRCFFCRSELFQKMEALAAQRGVAILAYGENADDAHEVRPGRTAAGKFQVASPLREAGLGKADIRALAKEAGLSLAEKPASPCLSSRLAPGLAVTPERLAVIDRAETAVRAHGFRIVRVRHLGTKALLQVSPEETARLEEPELRQQLTTELITAGFAQVEFDPAGYQGAGLR